MSSIIAQREILSNLLQGATSLSLSLSDTSVAPDNPAVGLSRFIARKALPRLVDAASKTQVLLPSTTRLVLDTKDPSFSAPAVAIICGLLLSAAVVVECGMRKGGKGVKLTGGNGGGGGGGQRGSSGRAANDSNRDTASQKKYGKIRRGGDPDDDPNPDDGDNGGDKKSKPNGRAGPYLLWLLYALIIAVFSCTLGIVFENYRDLVSYRIRRIRRVLEEKIVGAVKFYDALNDFHFFEPAHTFDDIHDAVDVFDRLFEPAVVTRMVEVELG